MTLAAIPRTVRQGLEPSVPGLPDLFLLSVALFAVALVSLLLPYCGEKARKSYLSIARPIVVALGVVATVALIAVELSVMYIGRDSLGYRRYSQYLIAAEFCCGLLSLFGWTAAQPEGKNLGAPRAAFLLGMACPFAVMMFSSTVMRSGGALLASVISSVAMGISLMTLRALNCFPKDFALRYLAGQVFFSTIWWGRWVEEPVLARISSITLPLCVLAGIAAALVGFYRAKEWELSAGSSNKALAPPSISPLDNHSASASLSSRERQVTERTLAGKTDAQIAEELAISKSSVATLRRRSYLKLGVSGKKELLETMSADHCATVPPDDTNDSRGQGLFLGSIALAMIAAALVILKTTGLLVPSMWGGYLARPAVLVLLLFACLSKGPDIRPNGGDTQVSVPLIAAQALGAILLAYGMRSAAGQDYFQEPVYYAVVGLALLVFAQGFDSSSGKASVSDPSFWIRIMRNGVASFSTMDYRLGLMCAAAVMPFDLIGYRSVAPGVVQGLLGLSQMLLLAILVLCAYIASRNVTTCLDDESLVGEGINRVVLYLRGRGLSEAQARAIAYLILGASPQQVSTLCHVSQGSLGTFRTRAYKKLGVKNMDDLRVLIERETGFPKRDKMSPIK